MRPTTASMSGITECGDLSEQSLQRCILPFQTFQLVVVKHFPAAVRTHKDVVEQNPEFQPKPGGSVALCSCCSAAFTEAFSGTISTVAVYHTVSSSTRSY